MWNLTPSFLYIRIRLHIVHRHCNPDLFSDLIYGVLCLRATSNSAVSALMFFLFMVSLLAILSGCRSCRTTIALRFRGKASNAVEKTEVCKKANLCTGVTAIRRPKCPAHSSPCAALLGTVFSIARRALWREATLPHPNYPEAARPFQP